MRTVGQERTDKVEEILDERLSGQPNEFFSLDEDYEEDYCPYLSCEDVKKMKILGNNKDHMTLEQYKNNAINVQREKIAEELDEYEDRI